MDGAIRRADVDIRVRGADRRGNWSAEFGLPLNLTGLAIEPIDRTLTRAPEHSSPTDAGTFPRSRFEWVRPFGLAGCDAESEQVPGSCIAKRPPPGARNRAQHASARGVLPKLTTGLTVESVDSCLGSRFRINIRTGDDAIGRHKDVAVKEVLLRRCVANIRFPSDLAGRYVDAAEHPVARAEIHALTRDRGRVRESASGFELPEDVWLPSLRVRRRG